MRFKMRVSVGLIFEECFVGDDGTEKEGSEGGDGLLFEDSISFEFLPLIIYDRFHRSFIPSLTECILFLNFPSNFSYPISLFSYQRMKSGRI